MRAYVIEATQNDLLDEMGRYKIQLIRPGDCVIVTFVDENHGHSDCVRLNASFHVLTRAEMYQAQIRIHAVSLGVADVIEPSPEPSLFGLVPQHHNRHQQQCIIKWCLYFAALQLLRYRI